jgi:hypothetical protein
MMGHPMESHGKTGANRRGDGKNGKNLNAEPPYFHN